MRPRLIRAGLAAALVAAFATGPADATPEADKCLAVETALALSANRDPAVLAAAAQRREAAADLTDAKSLFRPQLSAFGRTGVGDVGLVDGVIQNQVGVRASQRIFDFGDAKYARRAARGRLGAAEEDVRGARLGAARATALAIVDYLQADAALAATRERRAYFARQTQAIARALEAGGATRLEYAEVAAAEAEAAAFAIDLANQRREAATAIAIDTGLQIAAPLDGAPAPTDARPCAATRVEAALIGWSGPLVDAETAVAVAMKRSPVLEALERRAESFEAQKKREARTRLPVVDVVGIGAYSSLGATGDFEFQERVGVDVSVPIYSGRALAARTERAIAREALARSRLAQSRREFEEEARVLFGRVLALEAQTARRRTVRARNADRFDAAEAERRLGGRTLPDLVEARLDFERASLGAIGVEHDLLRARIELLSLAALLPAGRDTAAP